MKLLAVKGTPTGLNGMSVVVLKDNQLHQGWLENHTCKFQLNEKIEIHHLRHLLTNNWKLTGEGEECFKNLKPQTINRMNLDDVITFFTNEGNIHAAHYFKSMESEPQVLDGYIDYEFVKRYCSSYEEKMLRKLQANVVTLWDCNF
ncbi:MAG: hypothetical protein ACOVNU_08055 [Candidatus Kapaibacteriota bacterium]